MAPKKPSDIRVFNDIREPISVLQEAGHFGATLILVYAGIDAMATLNRPEGQDQVTRNDFIEWSERYVVGSLPHVSGKMLYSARCAVLHSYGVESKLTGEGVVALDYTTNPKGGTPPQATYKDAKHPDLIVVDIRALVTAFFDGIDRFMVDLFKHAPALAEERIKKMLAKIRIRPD